MKREVITKVKAVLNQFVSAYDLAEYGELLSAKIVCCGINDVAALLPDGSFSIFGTSTSGVTSRKNDNPEVDGDFYDPTYRILTAAVALKLVHTHQNTLSGTFELLVALLKHH